MSLAIHAPQHKEGYVKYDVTEYHCDRCISLTLPLKGLCKTTYEYGQGSITLISQCTSQLPPKTLPIQKHMSCCPGCPQIYLQLSPHGGSRRRGDAGSPDHIPPLPEYVYIFISARGFGGSEF